MLLETREFYNIRVSSSEGVTIINTRSSFKGTSKYIKQKLTELKAEIHNSVILVANVNILLSIRNRTTG